MNEDNYVINNLEKTEITLCFDLKERNKKEGEENKKCPKQKKTKTTKKSKKN